MNSDGRALNELVLAWWMEGPDDSRLSALLNLALTADSASYVPIARALSILEKAELPPSLSDRVSQLRKGMLGLQSRLHQVDALGDLDNDPETVYAILGDELASGGCLQCG